MPKRKARARPTRGPLAPQTSAFDIKGLRNIDYLRGSLCESRLPVARPWRHGSPIDCRHTEPNQRLTVNVAGGRPPGETPGEVIKSDRRSGRSGFWRRREKPAGARIERTGEASLDEATICCEPSRGMSGDAEPLLGGEIAAERCSHLDHRVGRKSECGTVKPTCIPLGERERVAPPRQKWG